MALKSVARWVVLGALFLVPFIPLYVAGDQYFPFITGKAYIFRMLMEIALGAYVLLALADPKYRPKFSWTLALYGAFVVWMAIADFLAVNPHKAFWSNYERMDGWVTMIHVFLFFIAAGAVLSADKLWKRWWWTVLGASVLVSLYGLWQMFGFTEIHQGGVRADASFGNAIYLAVYLMFTIGIALWLALEKKGVWRWLLIALAVIQLVIVFATATRGVILGIFGAAGLIALLLAVRAGGSARKSAIGALIALIALAGAFFLLRDSSFVRSEPTLSRIATVFEAGELKVRMTLWRMAFEGFAARPITGWGQEGYNYIFNTYYDPSLYAQEPWFDRAHNTYLDWLTAGGLPALLLFVALLVAAARAILVSEASRTERYLLLGIIVAYAFQAISAFDNLFSYILLAAVLAMAHDLSSRPIGALERMPAAGATALGAVALPVVLVASLGAVWLVNVPGMQAGSDLIRAAGSSDPSNGLVLLKQATASGTFATQEVAEQTVTFAVNVLAQTSLPVDFRQQTFTFATDVMSKELAQAPRDARLHLMFGQLLRAAGDNADAKKELDNSIALSPNKQQTYYQRGILLWQAGDRQGAAKDFTTAYDLDHDNLEAAAYAAAGHILLGDLAGGSALLMSAYGTTTVDADILRYVYFDQKLFGPLIDSAKAHLAAAPNDTQRALLLAQTYIYAGHIADARATLTALIAAHPEAASSAADLLKQVGQ